MSKQIYAFIPIQFPNQANRVAAFVDRFIPILKKEYQEMENGKEKEEIGMIIHDVCGLPQKVKEPQYQKNWDDMSHIFYPKSTIETEAGKGRCPKCNASISLDHLELIKKLKNEKINTKPTEK